MKGPYQTTMGGSHGAFLTTEWTVIDHIRSGDKSSSAVLMNDLLKKYWKPVYCYLRRKGFENEQAKDLTQGFFQEIVLERALIEHADKSRGRFRTFLLTALQQYIAEAQRKQNSRKAKPKGFLLSLDELESSQIPEAPAEFSPEDSFNYAWAAQLLDQLLEEVEAKCRADGKAIHWQVFHDKVLRPIIESTDAPSMEEICRRYGVESPSKASNMIVTVNRRFRAALTRHIRHSVVQDCEVDAEFQELFEIFAKGSAR
jgi:DNA-directed RNA polymerase specialized sigma24 family protein